MTAVAPRFLRCGDETLLARGPESGPQVLILQPLFEEMNRCRTILADVQRGLAAAGIGSALVDLPGTGESTRALEDVTFADWRAAVAEAAALLGPEVHALGVRGGCLLDDVAGFASCWRLAPVNGARLLSELDRATLIGGRADGLRAGYPLADGFVEALVAATPPASDRVRTARLGGDPAEADLRIAAAPPWRRSEPSRDKALSDAIAADVAAWIARCAA